MPEFRVYYNQPKFVDVIADDEEQAKQLVRDDDFEYGMDTNDGDKEILIIEEI
jgi:hypothetical protein